MNEKVRITVEMILVGMVILLASLIVMDLVQMRRWTKDATTSSVKSSDQVDQDESNLHDWIEELDSQSNWINLTLKNADPNTKYHVLVGTFSEEGLERASSFSDKKAMDFAEYQDRGIVQGAGIKIDGLDPITLYAIKVYLVNEKSGGETLYGEAIILTSPL